MTPGGGTIAAFGLKYQYMATVEQFLQHLRDSPELIARTSLVVEPVVVGPDGADDDIVDFGFLTDGEATHHFQVKASLEPSKNPLQPAPAREALGRLIAHDANSAVLYTNKPLSPGLSDEVIVDDSSSARGTTSFVWPTGPGGEASDSMDRRPRITVDERPLRELRDSIANLVREFRKERGRSQGQITCSLLVPIMLDQVFGAASGSEPSRIEALDLLETVAMPDPRIAKVAGAFDWGLPIAGIPNYVSTVPRLDYLSEIRHKFPTDASAAPPRVVLVGHTGIGKSVIASDYCHLDAIAYEFMCWVDCRDADFIDAQIVNHVQQLTGGAFVPNHDVAAVFTGILGRRSGPWLLVLDGVEQRSDIDRYLPTRGHGVVLVTSTNSLNWWPGAHVISVGEFTSREAIDCFAAYAGVDVNHDPGHVEVLEDLVEQLGHVPLAVSMAGIYFRNTDGTVRELAPQYFADLAALDDTYSIPPGFNRTAFKAIQHAVRLLGRYGPNEYGRAARLVLEMGSMLAPEQLPLNLLLPVATWEGQMNVADAPQPVEAEPALRRGVVSALKSQSIARRIVHDRIAAVPTSEMIALHPLVHRILRLTRLASLPPGQLESDASVLMHFLRGWLGSSRVGGDYFGTERLRMHSEALLAVLEEHEPLDSYSGQHHRAYVYTKAMLEAELSTCHASRRRFDLSLKLGQSAGTTLATLRDEPTARAMNTLVVTNMITDLSLAQAPSEALAAITSVALPAIVAGIADEKESIRDLSYHCAGELQTMLNRTTEYQAAPELQQLRMQISTVVGQDPDPDSRPSTVNTRINELYESGRFADLAELLPELRESSSSPDQLVQLDALEIVIKLHLGNMDEVEQRVEALIAIDPHGGYLTHSLVESLSKVGREAHRISQANGNTDPRLYQVLVAVTTRWTELTDTVQSD